MGTGRQFSVRQGACGWRQKLGRRGLGEGRLMVFSQNCMNIVFHLQCSFMFTLFIVCPGHPAQSVACEIIVTASLIVGM